MRHSPRIGYLHPASDSFMSSAELDPRVVGQLDGPCEIIDLPLARGEWAGVDDFDFATWSGMGIDALYYSPRHYHALPFVARERSSIDLPILTMAFSAAGWMDVWLLLAPLVRSADLILAPTNSAMREIQRIVKLGPPLLLNRFGLDLGRVNQAIAGVEPPSDRVRLLFFSRVVPEKGVEAAIGALSLLRDISAVELVVVGPAEPYYASRLRALAAKLAVSDLVSFRPTVRGADKWRTLAESSLQVLPSVYAMETAATAVIDGLAAGLPAAASAWTGIPEEVESGSNGVLIPVAWSEKGPRITSEAVAEAIRPLLLHPDTLAAMRPVARRTGSAHDYAVTRQSLVDRLMDLPKQSARDNRWPEVSRTPLRDRRDLVNPALLALPTESPQSSNPPSTRMLPALSEMTFGELLQMLDEPGLLGQWRRRWWNHYFMALMGPAPVNFSQEKPEAHP